MRISAFVLRMFGGFAGVYFAQLLVAGTALFGAVVSIFGGQNAGVPLSLALGTLACYTLGIIGGALAIQRPGAAAVLMLLAAIGGTATTIAIGLAPSGSYASSQALALALPFGAPVLLAIGGILAAMCMSNDEDEDEDEDSLRPTGRRRFVSPERAIDEEDEV